MSNTLEHLNHSLSDWREEFDLTSSVSLKFHQTEDGQLALNDLSLCPLQELTLESIRMDPAYLLFFFEGNRSIRLLFSWPEDEAPYLSSVYFGYDNLR